MSVWDWSTTAGTNASADAAINWAEGQLPSTVNNSARAMMAALKAFVQDTGGVTTAGSSNAYTVTLSQTMASASKGIIGIIADRANTGAATLNVDGLGANPLRMVSGTDLSAGDIVAGGFYIVTWVSGTSEWLLLRTTFPASALGNVGEGFAAGGRLTLTTATPVLTTTVSGATTVYYTPYLHDMIPIWNGTNFIPTRFTELSQATTDNTKSPAAVTTSSNYDVFVWSDSGTLRATRGPAWSSGTARGTGAGTTELSRVRGVLVNANAITNGPGAGYGTYVGTIRSNASSTIDFILGGSASGGTAAVLNVWNMYNRSPVRAIVTDSGASYTYSGGTTRQARASAGNQISFTAGLAEDAIHAIYQQRATTAAVATSFCYIGLGLDSTSGGSSHYSMIFAPTAAAFSSRQTVTAYYPPSLGNHIITANETGDGTNSATFNVDTQAILSSIIQM